MFRRSDRTAPERRPVRTNRLASCFLAELRVLKRINALVSDTGAANDNRVAVGDADSSDDQLGGEGAAAVEDEDGGKNKAHTGKITAGVQ